MPPQFDARPPHQHSEGVKGVGAGKSSPLATVLEKVAHNAISIAHFFPNYIKSYVVFESKLSEKGTQNKPKLYL